MQLQIYPDHSSQSEAAAELILSTIRRKPGAVLCLATGDTPRLTYNLVVEKALEEKLHISDCFFIGLDEWLGIPRDNEGTCHHFLHNLVFQPLGINSNKVHLFDSMTPNPLQECRQMNEVIAGKGGIDLMLVGVGMNGHLGFNEPGVSPDLQAHVITLDETTRTVGQKYFQQTTSLNQGITLGLQQVLQSRQLVMMASGLKKSGIVKQAIDGPVSATVPASYIQVHFNGIALLDEDAAHLIAR
jgi:galactosamine-6-phosphate isomerase